MKVISRNKRNNEVEWREVWDKREERIRIIKREEKKKKRKVGEGEECGQKKKNAKEEKWYLKRE